MPQGSKYGDHWLGLIAAITIALCVIIGLLVEGYMAITSTAIPDQFDRLVNLLAGGLLGFLARGAVQKVGANTADGDIVIEPTPPDPPKE